MLLLEKKLNIRRKVVTANRMIATSTGWDMQQKLRKNTFSVSIRTIVSLKHFFINYATDELNLYQCKFYYMLDCLIH